MCGRSPPIRHARPIEATQRTDLADWPECWTARRFEDENWRGRGKRNRSSVAARAGVRESLVAHLSEYPFVMPTRCDRLSLCLVAATLLPGFGCAAASEPPSTAPDMKLRAALKRAADDHATLQTQLSAAPDDKLSRCRLTDGDCLISVAEGRETLVRSTYLTQCTRSDPENQGRCVIQELEHRQEFSKLASYYELENWCFRTLLKCVTQ